MERIIAHVVVLDFSGIAFVVDVIRRIRYHKVCLAAIHELLKALRQGTVTTKESMPSYGPKITFLGDRRFFQFGIYVKVVIGDVFS